jgi:circadian clock protein KaiB
MTSHIEIVFKLYIIEKSPRAKETIVKLKSFLDSNLKIGYKLDVIDILTFPEKAVNDNVMASPTLIKEKPLPPKRVVGGIHFKNIVTEFDLAEFIIN